MLSCIIRASVLSTSIAQPTTWNTSLFQKPFVFIRVHWWLTPHLRAAWTVRAERWKSACRLNSIHLRNLTNVSMLSSLKESNGLDRLRPSA